MQHLTRRRWLTAVSPLPAAPVPAQGAPSQERRDATNVPPISTAPAPPSGGQTSEKSLTCPWPARE